VEVVTGVFFSRVKNSVTVQFLRFAFRRKISRIKNRYRDTRPSCNGPCNGMHYLNEDKAQSPQLHAQGK
jgi:hypothetical protein